VQSRERYSCHRQLLKPKHVLGGDDFRFMAHLVVQVQYGKS